MIPCNTKRYHLLVTQKVSPRDSIRSKFGKTFVFTKMLKVDCSPDLYSKEMSVSIIESHSIQQNLVDFTI